MEKPFDIFWFGDSGPSWVDAVSTLESARAYIEKLRPQNGPGGYGVFDQRTGKRITFAPKVAVAKVGAKSA
ncbi:MAG: hypothetical protein M3N22_09970 [Acidobacteriota bacterium]|nr:hypothetical protein [Acidobacteriota bacterium]